jgi:hypothetical protein
MQASVPAKVGQVTKNRDEADAFDEARPYAGSSFADVWRLVKANPYHSLPHDQVTLASFFEGLQNRLLAAGRRSLHDGHDVLPYFDKLIRPNGICLSGTWRIDALTPYSGYFRGGREGLVIVRASVGLSETQSGRFRAFGMAGKLYPTTDRASMGKLKTANFFVIDDNSGTLLDHYLDAPMVTEPRLSFNAGLLQNVAVLASVAFAQRLADASPGSRQLYPIAELGGESPARTPKFMMIRGAPGSRVKAADFRDQLHVADYDGVIPFEILVRDDTKNPWAVIGRMELDDDVCSCGCDHRLHFSHPLWRRDA